MAGLARRTLLLGSGAAVGWAIGRGFKADLPAGDGTASLIGAPGPSILNDASGLSATPVHKHIILPQNADQTLLDALRAELAEAADQGRPVNIGAARHSMGGQAIPRDGHAITFDNGTIELDSTAGTYRAHAGARWSQIIARLDPQGWSPLVMQSNNDFGVAATFCVNAHGWPVPLGPMGATVRSVDLLLPDGDLVTCSRRDNSDLFDLTMGGYGLTGAIVSMEVDMTRNQRLVPTFERMPASGFATAFSAGLDDPDVSMAYGRLNVDRAGFFEEALLITYRADADQADLPAAAGSGVMSKLARHIYRAQLGREWAKHARWWVETGLGPAINSGAATRNSLINEPVVTLDDRDPGRTDILHEYFVAPDRFNDFLTLCKAAIPASFQSFLNVTLRFVDTDARSLLNYAPVPRIAAVMSFSQEMTTRAEADMIRLTRALIDGVTAIGGTYYLPYRPHATPDQFVAAYPQAAAFGARKRALDPGLLFRNTLWDRYLEPL